MNNRIIDLTKKAGTIGNMMMAHRDEILGVKSSNEAFQLMKKLFEENNINTPKSREILMKLQRGMNYVQTITYLNNIMMKAQGLGILDSEKAYESYMPKKNFYKKTMKFDNDKIVSIALDFAVDDAKYQSFDEDTWVDKFVEDMNALHPGISFEVVQYKGPGGWPFIKLTGSVGKLKEFIVNVYRVTGDESKTLRSLGWSSWDDFFRDMRFNVTECDDAIEEDEFEEDEMTSEREQRIEESESAFSHLGSIVTYYCKDFIIADAPDNVDLKIAEVYASDNAFIKDRLPIALDDDDINSLKKNSSSSDAYRFFVYYVNSKYDSKWYDAIDAIETKEDFLMYIDPENAQWKDDPDSYPADFASTFQTYEDWISYIAKNNKKTLCSILDYSGKLPYSSLVNDVKVNNEGIAYVIIGWRA